MRKIFVDRSNDVVSQYAHFKKLGYKAIYYNSTQFQLLWLTD